MSDGQVVAFLGEPGAGKTYVMSAEALKWRRMYPHLNLFSTYNIRLEGCQLTNPPFDDGVPIVEASNGLLLIDEAALILDSRMYQRTPIDLLHKLMQVRKYRLRVWWSTQYIEYVDKRLRLLTFESFHPSSYAKLPIKPFFWVTRRSQIKGSRISQGPLFRTPERDALYDTEEIVQRAAYLEDLRRGARQV